MLKGLDPLLTADLLYVLAAMGHGDEVALVDRNFPAHSVAGEAPLITMAGADTLQAGRAILSVLPLDSFVDTPIVRMEQVGDPITFAAVQSDFQSLAGDVAGAPVAFGGEERFAFYDRAAQAFAVVATGESRPYGCFLIKKGVL